MVTIGYTISSEEFRPQQLADQAAMAESAGFSYASISDHFHPWLDSQGESPFVWSVLGAISQRTSEILVGTGVTCPIQRIHPVILAQAAATAADFLPNRFYFGVGTGELLNEHITGEKWPVISTRQEMLAESLTIIRKLWEGSLSSHDGQFFTIENARIYTLPETLPPIYVAASGVESSSLAAEIGDGLISTSSSSENVDAYKSNNGSGPVIGQVTVCWGADRRAQIELAKTQWGFNALPGQFSQELALPLYFEQGLELVTDEAISNAIVCGPDIELIHQRILEFVDSGFSHVYLHQVGPDQEGFIDMARKEILPRYSA